MIKLVLYSRPGCHLCDEMLEELLPMIAGKASVEKVDISGDIGLEREYGIRIPVLAYGDEELSDFPLDRARVETFLHEL